MARRAPRRPAPPSERLYPEVPWVEPEQVDLPMWRRVLSGAELGALVIVLGVLLTVSLGVLLVMTFFVLDFLVG